MSALLRRAAPLALILALAACQTALDGGLSERAANDEVALLLRHGIPASRAADPKTGDFTVSVDRSRFADAVDLLRAHGLPGEKHPSVVDIFKGDGLVVSPTAERARMTYALGEELARTIDEIDGVLSARVHIVVPDADPLAASPPPASASVFVRYRDGSPVASLLPQIKMLVADGVSGLDYGRVSVVMVPAATVAETDRSPPMTAVFGLWVYEGSAGAVRLLLAAVGGLATAVAILAGLLLWRARPPALTRALDGARAARLLLR